MKRKLILLTLSAVLIFSLSLFSCSQEPIKCEQCSDGDKDGYCDECKSKMENNEETGEAPNDVPSNDEEKNTNTEGEPTDTPNAPSTGQSEAPNEPSTPFDPENEPLKVKDPFFYPPKADDGVDAPFINVEIPTVEKIPVNSYFPVYLEIAPHIQGDLYYYELELKITAADMQITNIYGDCSEGGTLTREYTSLEAKNLTDAMVEDYAQSKNPNLIGFEEPFYFLYTGGDSTSGIIAIKAKIDGTVDYSKNERYLFFATDGEYIAFSLVSEEKAKLALSEEKAAEYTPPEKESKTAESYSDVPLATVESDSKKLTLTVIAKTLSPCEIAELKIEGASAYSDVHSARIAIYAAPLVIEGEDGESAEGHLYIDFEMDGAPSEEDLSQIIKSVFFKSGEQELFKNSTVTIVFTLYNEDKSELDRVKAEVNYGKYSSSAREDYVGNVQFLKDSK